MPINSLKKTGHSCQPNVLATIGHEGDFMKRLVVFDIVKEEVQDNTDFTSYIANSVQKMFGFRPEIDSENILNENGRIKVPVSLASIPPLKKMQKNTLRHLYNEMEEIITEVAASNHDIVNNGSRGSISYGEMRGMIEGDTPHSEQDPIFIYALFELGFSQIKGLDFVYLAP
tara:strand:+ start:44 stop:559 length:516 start_codon:yes stop_codon:yes gene_type:complete